MLWIAPLVVALGLGVPLVRSAGGLGDPPQILDFRIEPSIADPGAQIVVRWSVDGAKSVRLDPLPGPLEDESGSVTVTAPDQTTTFVLTAVNRGQTRTSSIELQIAPQPPTIGLFDAEPNQIAPGDKVLLSWNVVGDDTAVKILPGDGSLLSQAGSAIVDPTESTVYTLTATNPAGRTIHSVQVIVGESALPQPPVIARFDATPASIDRRGDAAANAPTTVTLAWSVAGAESVEIIGEESRSGLSPEGTLDLAAPARTTTYFLVATNQGGAVTGEVAVTVTADATVLPPPVVVRPLPPGDDSAVVEGALPDGSNNGNTIDGAGTDAVTSYADPPPEVNLLTVSPNPARVGDEVVVRWAVSNAETVSVRTAPAEPNTTPLIARAGVFRFIARDNVAVLLEATSAGGATVRRQVGVLVRHASSPPTTVDVGAGAPPLLAIGGHLDATALVTESGDVWLYWDQSATWEWVGSLEAKSISVAIADHTLFAVGDDGLVRALDLLDRSGALAHRVDPWRRVAPLDLGPNCREVAAVAAHERAGADASAAVTATLLVACIAPSPVVVALPVHGTQLSPPRWMRNLVAAPLALSLGAPDGAAVVVRYPLYSPRSERVDLLDVSSGAPTELAFPGQVTAAVPSPDGKVVVASVAGDAALYVVDRQRQAPRRIELEGEVAGLAWASSEIEPLPTTTTPPEAPAGGTDAFGETNPVLPTPTPPATDPHAATAAANPGAVLVTWLYDTGGALVSLAPWTPTTIVAAVINPTRPLAGLIDDGDAIIAVTLAPHRGAAFRWGDRAGTSP